MILSGLFQWFYQIFSMVEPLTIPNLDYIVGGYVDIVDLAVQGVSLLRYFAGDTAIFFLSIYLAVVAAINVFYMAYQILWFIITKIPLLNVKQ